MYINVFRYPSIALPSPRFGSWGYQCLAILPAFSLRFRIIRLIWLMLHQVVSVYLRSCIFCHMLCCKLTLKIKADRWLNVVIALSSVWCWVKPCPGVPLLPPKISFTTPGSLMAECSITDSDGFSLLKLRPLFKIMSSYFCLDPWPYYAGFCVLFFLLAGISHCLSFPSCFICLYCIFIFSYSPYCSYHLLC